MAERTVPRPGRDGVLAGWWASFCDDEHDRLQPRGARKGSPPLSGGHPEEEFPVKVLASSSPRSVTTNLPPGAAVDPQATTARCEEAALEDEGACPPSSAVGLVAAYTTGFPYFALAPRFNMVASAGVPAQFGANVAGFGHVVHIDGRLRGVPGSEGAYGLSGEVTSIQDTYPIYAVVATFWGDPSASAHNDLRGACGAWGSFGQTRRTWRQLPAGTV